MTREDGAWLIAGMCLGYLFFVVLQTLHQITSHLR